MILCTMMDVVEGLTIHMVFGDEFAVKRLRCHFRVLYLDRMSLDSSERGFQIHDHSF